MKLAAMNVKTRSNEIMYYIGSIQLIRLHCIVQSGSRWLVFHHFDGPRRTCNAYCYYVQRIKELHGNKQPSKKPNL